MPTGFLNFLSGLSFLRGLIQGILDVIRWLFALIQGVLVFLWNTLVLVVNTVWRGLRALARTLRPLWNNVLRPIVRTILLLYKKLQIVLFTIIRPALKAIECANQVLDDIERKIIRPIAQGFFILHQYIRVIGIFNKGLARKLDRRIASVEQKIFGGFFAVRQAVNRQAVLLNEIITDALLLNPVFLWRSLVEDIEVLRAVILGRRTEGAVATEIRAVLLGRARRERESVRDALDRLDARRDQVTLEDAIAPFEVESR